MKERDFDALLDGALREDAAAEPRDGFESRVLERVRADAERDSARWWNRWRGWLLVPAAACAGLIAVVWYGTARTVASPVSPSASSASQSEMKPEVVAERHSLTETDGGLRLGNGGRASREPHLRRDMAAPKMGHPVVVAFDAKPLPKLDVLPSPAPVDAFPTPVQENAKDQDLAEALESPEAIAALVSLQKEQSGPVRVAALRIPPLAGDE